MGKVFLITASWLPAVMYMALLTYISCLPGDRFMLPSFPMADKLAHYLSYLILGIVLENRSIIFHRINQFSYQRIALWPGLAAGIVHSVTNESLHLMVPLREFSVLDIVANLLGVVTGIFLCRRLSGLME